MLFFETLSKLLGILFIPFSLESRLRPNAEKVVVNCQFSMAVFR